MKRALRIFWGLAAWVLLSMPNPALASLMAYDGFGNYTTTGGYPSNAIAYDSNSGGQNPGTLGFTEEWSSPSALASWVYPRAETGQLVYNDGSGSQLQTSPGQANLFRSQYSASAKTMSRDLALSNSLPGALYVSFLARFTGGYPGWGIDSASTDGSSVLPFGMTVDSTGSVDLFGSNTTTLTDVTTLTDDTTHLIVLKLENNIHPGAPNSYTGDGLTLFVDPLLSSEVLNTPIATLSGVNSNFYVAGNPGFSLDSLNIDFSPDNGDSLILDEFRIGTTWADVTPIPEPSTAMLLIGFFANCALFLRRRRRLI